MEIFTAKEENKCTERDRESERMDRPLFDKYCEMRSRGGGVFIADININFSWRGSPGPAWARHWETGEEILQAARERNQRPGALRPLTH